MWSSHMSFVTVGTAAALSFITILGTLADKMLRLWLDIQSGKKKWNTSTEGAERTRAPLSLHYLGCAQPPAASLGSTPLCGVGVSQLIGELVDKLDRNRNCTRSETKFHPRMKPQPITWDAHAITWPIVRGANILMTWSSLHPCKGEEETWRLSGWMPPSSWWTQHRMFAGFDSQPRVNEGDSRFACRWAVASSTWTTARAALVEHEQLD